MSNQSWADAATANCLWLLQKRWIPFPIEAIEDGEVPDEACWNTESVHLTRLEAYETGARRVYNYGKYGKDWRIYGVPGKGKLVELLAAAGVTQALIDAGVETYRVERKEWEAVDKRCKDHDE